jgi:hypothetical protein
MTDHAREPRPLLPFLEPFYRVVVPLAWPLIRLGVGWNLIVHGWGKVLRGPAGQAVLLARDGFDYGIPLALLLIFVELIGGICIALGLFIIGATDSPGSGRATSTRCCGARSASQSQCAAAGRFRSTGKSDASFSSRL